MHDIYIYVTLLMLRNCANILEHDFLVNFIISACTSGGLVLGEGISKFENKNFGTFYAFEKSISITESYVFIVILKCILVL